MPGPSVREKKGLHGLSALGLVVATLLVLVLARRASFPETLSAGRGMGRHMSEVMRKLGTDRLDWTYASNGERIYYTATSASGQPIIARIGLVTMTGPMMSCVDCHGLRGQGGPIRYCIECHGEESPMVAFRAPPLTLYEDKVMTRAITRGIGPDGRPLITPMPRWFMSKEDLADLLAYLRSLRQEKE